jgi:hypothetical protein
MFGWLEGTPAAQWVSLSLWVYPMLLSIHILGLAVVVGIFLMRDMRLLGLFNGLDPVAFLSLSRFAWFGFIINAISGALLFISQAVAFSGNTAFLVKIALIIIGMILAVLIHSRLRNEFATAGEVIVNRSTRAFALCSLSIWIGAIVAGRLVAYII